MTEYINLDAICARVKVRGPVISDPDEFLTALKAELDAISEDLYASLEELEDIRAELDESAEL